MPTRTGGRDGRQPTREPLPLVRPMLAVSGDLPEGEGWAYEVKWDGMRCLAYVEGGTVRLRSRSGREVTAGFPELGAMAGDLGRRRALLDGELVALDASGRPSFGALQPRMQVGDAARARRLVGRIPVTYMVFDLLHLDDRSTLADPYLHRRRLLDDLGLAGPAWAVPPSSGGPGADVLAAAAERGLEGVVAKRAGSPYRPGRRHPDWTKVKRFLTQEVVVGGWSAGQGRRRGGVGALLLGVPSARGLGYVGKVGTGFTDATLGHLARRLAGRARTTSPFAGPLPPGDRAGVTWVRPTLVGEVRHNGWTRDGRLRQASWRGWRPDKPPGDVVREGGGGGSGEGEGWGGG
ncbi:MAG: non-homologous end-joining DNA ligase [Acidimicrobiales bacterium]